MSRLSVASTNRDFARVGACADAPTMAGFGIKSVEDAATLAECSDGVVVGSSIVQMIADSSQSKEFDRIGKYLKEMKTAIS